MEQRAFTLRGLERVTPYGRGFLANEIRERRLTAKRHGRALIVTWEDFLAWHRSQAQPNPAQHAQRIVEERLARESRAT